jgi:hypothetical protein
MSENDSGLALAESPANTKGRGMTYSIEGLRAYFQVAEDRAESQRGQELGMPARLPDRQQKPSNLYGPRSHSFS